MTEQNNTTMQVFLGEQAKQLIIKESYPVGSIGVAPHQGKFTWWFWDGFIFDSGMESTEAKALTTAKMNLR